LDKIFLKLSLSLDEVLCRLRYSSTISSVIFPVLLTHGVAPLHEQFSDANEQASFILEYVKTIRDAGQQLSQICIVARTRYELKDIQSILEKGGIKVMQIKANHSDRGHNDSVRLATMHRVKGLEFDEVIIASFNEGLCPLKKKCGRPR